MVRITDTAQRKFLEVANAENRDGHYLRIVVHGGGTFSSRFALEFVTPGQESGDDRIQDAGSLKVVTDSESAKFLKDASVDFVDGSEGSGFKVTAPHAGSAESNNPLAEAVIRVLETKINPGIASHGGRVSLVTIDDGIAVLQFGGGCQGCGMINVTLKDGVEKTLLEDVPELKGVRDATDHAAGSNPYHR